MSSSNSKYEALGSGGATAYAAPGASGATAYAAPGASAEPLYCPGAMTARPSSSVLRIDDRAVEPESDYELLDGELVASPASPPHADCHVTLDYVLRAHVAPGYVASSDLLTRTSERWDFAADASIRKEGIDPQTGCRYLEELAFEVKYTQRPKMLAERARQLSQCGVRRIFAIWARERQEDGKPVLEAGPVKEWDPNRDSWRELDGDSEIVDPCLARPLKVQALLSAVEADNAVARALLSRGNPVLKERESNAIDAAIEAVILCRDHGIEITNERRAALKAMSAEELVWFIEFVSTQGRWPEHIS